MGDIARPMLAGVLAALTGLPADAWTPWLSPSAGPIRWEMLDRGPRGWWRLPNRAEAPMGPSPSWTITDPCEAEELLSERGLLPERWCGDVRRGWWCGSCDGRGAVTYQTDGGLEDDACGVCAIDDPDVTGGVRLTGYADGPASTPDLVALASLGWPAIHHAEQLAREACHALSQYGCPTPDRVVWRVAPRTGADSVVWRTEIATVVVALSRRGVLLIHSRVAPDGPVASVDALWTMGLALDAITADAVRIVVPPVGGVR